jgi:hypothetical protein
MDAEERSTIDYVNSDAVVAKLFTPPPSILIHDRSGGDGGRFAEGLRRRNLNVVLEIAETAPESATTQIDVAFVNLSSPADDGLARAGALASRCPWTECVFWVDSADKFPAVAVARSLGISRLISAEHLETWANQAIVHLVRMARARRDLQIAENSLPPLPRVDEIGRAMPLPEAERRFRESYLRRLLAETENQSLAARKAGLPYTTFRSMIKKLGLS